MFKLKVAYKPFHLWQDWPEYVEPIHIEQATPEVDLIIAHVADVSYHSLFPLFKQLSGTAKKIILWQQDGCHNYYFGCQGYQECRENILANFSHAPLIEPHRCKYLIEEKIPYIHLHNGAVNAWNNSPNDILNREYDIGFFGSCTPQRGEMLDYFRKKLPNYKIITGDSNNLMHKCKIGLQYGTSSHDVWSEGLPIRVFETTAKGAALLCFKQSILSTAFNVGTECLEFSSLEDGVDKARQLLESPEKLKQVAIAGYFRTISSHKAIHRINKMLIVALQLKNVGYERLNIDKEAYL